MSVIVRLAEWQVGDPRSEPALRCGPLAPELAKRVAALNQSGRLEILEVREGLRVATRSHVGSIRLGLITLQIRPKIAADLAPVFMRYALGLDATTVSTQAAVPVQAFSFVDLLALLLRDEVDVLLHTGLLQDYREEEAWLSSPRGKLLFAPLARQPALCRLAVPCRFNRRTPDTTLNRLVLAALAAIRPAVLDRALAFDLHAREALFAEFCLPVALSPRLLDDARAASDRRSRYYEPLLQIAELILAGLGPAFEADRSVALPGFLFDMNFLFERFVARLCRENAPLSLRIETQENLGRAYRYRANPHRWPLPLLRPDIVARTPTGTPVVVLDTKYKLLEGRKRPSTADLYQLTLYSVAFGHDRHVPARIIYPRLGPLGSEPVLEFVGFRGIEALAAVSVFGLDLNAVSEAIQRRDRPRLRHITSALLAPPGE